VYMLYPHCFGKQSFIKCTSSVGILQPQSTKCGYTVKYIFLLSLFSLTCFLCIQEEHLESDHWKSTSCLRFLFSAAQMFLFSRFLCFERQCNQMLNSKMELFQGMNCTVHSETTIFLFRGTS